MSEPESSQAASTTERTPLPLAQLLSVSLILIAEPVSGLCIYPFINEFIRDTGITGGDERKTGYYGGIIQSTFFLSESLTVVTWGYLSDRYGRRPVLLLAPLGLAATMLSFGLSTSFTGLVISRSLQGMFNGNIGVSRSVIAEITDSTNRADAFAILPLIWSVGSSTARFMGGLLSNPDQRWPEGIGRIPLLIKHPYFLPCAAAASVSIFGFIFAFMFLKETLPSLVEKDNTERRIDSPRRGTNLSEESPLLGGRNGPAPHGQTPLSSPVAIDTPPMPSGDETNALVTPLMLAVLCTGILAFIDMCHFSLAPLMWSTSIPHGGLGLNPFQIGVTQGIYGIVNAVIQINFLGPILRRYGPVRVFRCAIFSLIVCFAMYPLMRYLAQRAGYIDGFVMMCIVVQLCCQMTIYLAYGSIQVIVVGSVPPGGAMGVANGLAQMASSGSRTVAPALVTSLFALSLEKNLAGGNLVYYVCIGLTSIGIYGSSFLSPDKPKERAGTRNKF